MKDVLDIKKWDCHNSIISKEFFVYHCLDDKKTLYYLKNNNFHLSDRPVFSVETLKVFSANEELFVGQTYRQTTTKGDYSNFYFSSKEEAFEKLKLKLEEIRNEDRKKYYD